MMKSQEFQDRQNPNLGELPEDITTERTEFDTFYLEASETRAQHDIEYQGNIQNKSKVVGTVPYGGATVAHFDSRPINAVDFSFSSYDQWVVSGGITDTLLTTAYTVPNGFVCVFREFRYAMFPSIALEFNHLLADIRVNGNAPTGHNGLMHGEDTNGFIPTFFLAPAGALIRFNFRAQVALGIANALRKMQVEFRGNLLQDTGAPLEQEISNKRLQAPVSQVPGNVQRLHSEKKTKRRVRRPNWWGPLDRF